MHPTFCAVFSIVLSAFAGTAEDAGRVAALNARIEGRRRKNSRALLAGGRRDLVF